MTETVKLIYDVNHNYREGYDQGYEDSQNDNSGDMANGIALFIAECGEMAEKNWTDSQVKMLKWLMGAVLSGMEYADFAEEHMNDD